MPLLSVTLLMRLVLMLLTQIATTDKSPLARLFKCTDVEVPVPVKVKLSFIDRAIETKNFGHA